MIGSPIKLINYLSTQDNNKIFEVNEYHEKKSLSQNGYAWALITQLANTIRKSKEEIYLDMLKNYGQSTIVSIIKEVDPSKYFKYCELIGDGEINGRNFNHYRIYKGSSEFDSKEMSILIDGIIQECEQQGIPTLTKAEIEKLKLH